MAPPRTYWHLQRLNRKPTEYEVVTSSLLYYVSRGFEVRVPMEAWYRQYQQGSPLTCSDWERFSDPRETTYTKYTDVQNTREIFVDGLLKVIDDTGYDADLSPAWLRILARVLPPLRYPVHALQMIAAYIGHMAPAGRITIAALFQAADEMRRVQRLAYRMRQLQESHPEFGRDSQSIWQDDPLWQPLREVIEKLLVTYDWGEAFIALNLVLKPMFDELFMTGFGRLALREGDDLLGKIFLSLGEDCAWHRDWSRALVRLALSDTPANRAAMETWLDRWRPVAAQAMAAFAPVFDEMPARTVKPPFAEVMAHVDASCREYWTSAGFPLDRA